MISVDGAGSKERVRELEEQVAKQEELFPAPPEESVAPPQEKKSRPRQQLKNRSVMNPLLRRRKKRKVRVGKH